MLADHEECESEDGAENVDAGMKIMALGLSWCCFETFGC